MFKKEIILILLILSCGKAFPQKVVNLTLEQAIAIAQKESLDAKIIKSTLISSVWNDKSYLADFLPKLSLNGQLPDYYRSINLLTLPDGRNSFVSQNVAYSYANLNLSQNIGFTGGTLTASTSIRRLDNFGSFQNKLYTSVPLSVSYSQSNILFNPYRKERKIMALRATEAQRAFLEKTEDIACSTVDKYFDVLLGTIQLKLDEQNYKNIDTLYKTTKSRFEIGTSNLNDVLQARVSLLSAKKALVGTKLAFDTEGKRFELFLNVNVPLVLAAPEEINYFDVDEGIAMSQAKKNRKFVVEFKRRRLEAEQSLNRAKSQAYPSVSFRFNLGATQSSPSLINSYQDLIRNQSFSIGFNIPILDWGANKYSIKQAIANIDLEKNNMLNEESAAEQEILYQVRRWSQLKENMEMSKEVSELAQKRYKIALQKHLLGTLSFTEFNNAQLEKDRAVIDQIQNLRSYWSGYYTIRKLTLFDFKNNKPINIDEN